MGKGIALQFKQKYHADYLNAYKIVCQNGESKIAIPALGCGLGGLDYAEVKPLIEKAFVDLSSVEVFLYPPK